MERKLLLRGGTALLPEGLKPADILLSDGKIDQIGCISPAKDVQVMDVRGKTISPGFIDLHTHLREPGYSYKETIRTGSHAAAAGGYTLVCAMPNLSPVPDCMEALKEELDLIKLNALIDVLPYASITKEEKGTELSDIAALSPFCAGFSDDGKGVQSQSVMKAAMEKIASLDSFLSAHCEVDKLVPEGACVHAGECAARFGLAGIPSSAEWRQVKRDIALAEKTGVRYHVCHVSAKETVELVRKARKRGLRVTCECTPHQIMLCDEDIIEDDGRFKMNPPLRSRGDREAIIDGLLDGTVGYIVTDHAPHTKAEKAKGLAHSSFGIIGLETAFAVCYTALVKTNRMKFERLLRILTEEPARMLGREAALREGAHADLTVIDTDNVWHVDPDTFHSLGRSTPFAGMDLTSRVVSTFYHGKRVYHEGEII